MQVERTNSEILIRLSADRDISGLQRILDYLKFREITAKRQAKENDIDDLAKESKADWWLKNKSRFIK
ncbi:hypothetical protein ACLI09_08890 [Flavobacterium sp. RHBU_24]|uniref:hypothetical protein n=1 Tax=Flavobacterium sp. RHBU_24 TaxID=3391185 RepID=UPI003984ED36